MRIIFQMEEAESDPFLFHEEEDEKKAASPKTEVKDVTIYM